MTRILMVCMGNICRSPTAEGVMRSLVREAGLEDEIEIDSAGTGGWHVGDPPDRARDPGGDGPRRRARGRRAPGHAERLRGLRPAARDGPREPATRCWRSRRPPRRRGRRGCCAPTTPRRPSADLDVPDPYYGGPDGFELVLDQVEAACRGAAR